MNNFNDFLETYLLYNGNDMLDKLCEICSPLNRGAVRPIDLQNAYFKASREPSALYWYNVYIMDRAVFFSSLCDLSGIDILKLLNPYNVSIIHDKYLRDIKEQDNSLLAKLFYNLTGIKNDIFVLRDEIISMADHCLISNTDDADIKNCCIVYSACCINDWRRRNTQ